jgi:N-6 DNA Methylase
MNRRKRLGQYFTGMPLARLLAALAGAPEAKTIVDPMGGSGDMLAACLAVGASPRVLAGVEIDPLAADLCRGRLGPAASVVTGDAFAIGSWRDLPDAWDLVITNPPYVRYQRGSGVVDDLAVPTAAGIRAGLVEILTGSGHLDPGERRLFLDCARSYSGLADLAVPAWLLCASRVGVGGRIALVVPDTWLSRNYAVPVGTVLRRLFEIETVVVDGDVAWFDDALVRTNLVVARRVPDKGTEFGPGSHLRVTLPASAADGRSLVGAAFPAAAEPETALADWLRGLDGAATLPDGAATRLDGAATRLDGAATRLDGAATRLDGAATRLDGAATQPVPVVRSDESDLVRLLRHAGPTVVSEQPPVPEAVLRALAGLRPASLTTLGALGWRVGQGLRTGANEFFYVTRAADGTVRSALLPEVPLRLPDEVLRPAVRRQGELPRDGRRVLAEPSAAVLILDGWARPADAAVAGGAWPGNAAAGGPRGADAAPGWRLLDGDLARLVDAAAATSYARPGGGVPLPELSAVRTNIRQVPPRFWYHLPPLTDRHVPALYLARVNHGHPVPYLNPGRSLVVDANFTTLWPDPGAPGAHAVLALLSSSWVQACLEASATVLGGGALKVEATHVRRVPVPALDWGRLAELGARLAGGAAEPVNEIDRLVTAAVLPGATGDTVERLNRLAASLLSTRHAQPVPRVAAR